MDAVARSIAAPLVCASVLVAARARAEEPARVDLRWSAPAECPTEAQVRAAVERLAGRSLPATREPPIVVRIDVAKIADDAWTVQIAVHHPGSVAPRERKIAGATCAEVADAAAVATAIAITPGAAPPAAPPPAAPAPDRPAPPEPSRLTLRPALRVHGGVDFASLPAPSPGTMVSFVFLFGANRVEIQGSAWLPEEGTAATKPTAGGRLSLLAAGARYCRSVREGTIEVAGCGSLEAGAIMGSGFGITMPVSGAAPWIAPGVGGLGLWNFSRYFSLALAIEGLIPVVRRDFAIEGLGSVHRPPPISARAFFGVEARFR
jgi:hypothetical protein